MWHTLLHWLQLPTNRNSSSLFFTLLLFFHSFSLLPHSLRRIAFSFVQLSMKSQKQHFSRERLIPTGRKFQKVYELVFLSPKATRVLSSRRADSKTNAFKNPPTKHSSFFLFCLLSSILTSNSLNNFFWELFSTYMLLTGIFRMQEVYADLVYVFIHRVVNMAMLFQKYVAMIPLRTSERVMLFKRL